MPSPASRVKIGTCQIETRTPLRISPCKAGARRTPSNIEESNVAANSIDVMNQQLQTYAAYTEGSALFDWDTPPSPVAGGI